MRFHDDRLNLSPSDVTAFLACEHLTTLSLAHARGEIDRPEVENEQAELIFRKGLEHEQAYLESLRAHGKSVLVIPDPEGEFDVAALATAQAVRAGEADVIYQSVLAHENWRGVADFLMRQLDGTYEALDTKLARSAKPAYILQLLFYNEQLARIQSREPEHIHVLLGNRRAGDLPARRVRRPLPARPLTARALRRRRAGHRAPSRRPLLHRAA